VSRRPTGFPPDTPLSAPNRMAETNIVAARSHSKPSAKMRCGFESAAHLIAGSIATDDARPTDHHRCFSLPSLPDESNPMPAGIAKTTGIRARNERSTRCCNDRCRRGAGHSVGPRDRFAHAPWFRGSGPLLPSHEDLLARR
jgi:hypothetical protein